MNSLMSHINFGGLSLIQIAIGIVIVAGVLALVVIALRQFGIQIPEWFKQCLWVVAIVLVVVVCIKLVASIW